ncbi:MAG TPA: VWA domain-containing protein [Bryobacteraceae bacterium]|nr:VWA domain-containing protein [Bryobacteraceae bacterium]
MKLLLGLAACLCLAQDDNIPTFRSEVSLVKVDLRITDRGGRDIAGLNKQDFIVFDESERRDIVNFASESERDTVDVLLLLDVSGSMFQHLRELSSTTATALEKLDRGARVALMEFATRSQVFQPFTTDFRLVERRITESIFKQTLGRDTLVNEALLAAADYLQKSSQPRTRRFIVVVSDNAGTRLSVTDAQALRAVQSANVVVNAIVVGQQDDTVTPVRYTDPSASRFPDLNRYAQATGGTFVNASHVSDALRAAIGEIRTRYQLHYAAPVSNPGKYRRIRVELAPEAKRRHPEAVIAAREGYYAAQ